MAIRPVVTTAAGTLTALAAGASSATIYTVPASTETRIMLIAIDGLSGGDLIFLRSNAYRAVRILESDLVNGAIDLDAVYYYFEAGDVLTIQNGSAGAITITYYIAIIEQADTANVEARGITGTTVELEEDETSAVMYAVPVDTEARLMAAAFNDDTGTSNGSNVMLLNDYTLDYLVPEEGRGYTHVLAYMKAGDEIKLRNIISTIPDERTWHYYLSILERGL